MKPPFALKFPSEFTNEDLQDLSRWVFHETWSALTDGQVLLEWLDHLLSLESDESVVLSLRGLPSDLWAKLIPRISLGRLVFSDGEKAVRLTACGRIFAVMTPQERAEGLNECPPDSMGFLLPVVSFLDDFHPELINELLPVFESLVSGRRAHVCVTPLVATGRPDFYEAACRISSGIPVPFARFVAFREICSVDLKRHKEATFKAAISSLEGSDQQNNHAQPASWLCLHGGSAGIEQVKNYLATRETIWSGEVALSCIRILGSEKASLLGLGSNP